MRATALELFVAISLHLSHVGYIDVLTFPSILFEIGAMVNKYHWLREIQCNASHVIDFVSNLSRKILTKFVADGPISQYIASTYRNPRWRYPPSWLLVIEHLSTSNRCLDQNLNVIWWNLVELLRFISKSMMVQPTFWHMVPIKLCK